MAEAAPAAEKPVAPRKRLPMTLILIVVIALVEAVIFFVIFKAMGGGPQTTHGDETGTHAAEGAPAVEHPTSVEIELVNRFRVPNSVQGKTMLYDVDIVVKVSGARKDAVEKLKTERQGEILDAVAAIIRNLDPRELNEPDLKTLRFQIRRALSEIADDRELIQQVLVPRCVPMRG